MESLLICIFPFNCQHSMCMILLEGSCVERGMRPLAGAGQQQEGVHTGTKCRSQGWDIAVTHY